MTLTSKCNITPDRLKELMSAFLGTRDRDVCVAAFSLYIDDSGTAPEQSTAVAAGWIAKYPTWNFFNREWDKVRNVESRKFSTMHMASFVYGKGEFENWDLDTKKTVLNKLFPIFHRRIHQGFGLGVIKKDFDEIVPPELRAQGHENHYTYAIRRVMGFIHKWRQDNHVQEEIQYFFDFMDKHDPRRIEIEKVFTTIGTHDQNLAYYGLRRDGFHFLDKDGIPPLQAADMLAWTIYRAMQHEVGANQVNEIGKMAFKNFCLSLRKPDFVEGGYNKREHLIQWVKDKGLKPLVSS